MPFPAGITTITVTGLSLETLDGTPLNGVVIFTPSAPLDDPAVSAVLEGSATGEVVQGVMAPLVIPTTDSTDPTFTYTITTRLATPDGVAGDPLPVTGVEIPHTLGATVDVSALL